jgi:hypothetical protein
MTKPYSEQTQKILDDFLAALGEKEEMDSDLLANLHQMVQNGTLDNRGRIRQAVSSLEAKADELHD